MTTLQLILVSTSAVLLLGIAAISVLVGGRVSRPKNWKKQVRPRIFRGQADDDRNEIAVVVAVGVGVGCWLWCWCWRVLV